MNILIVLVRNLAKLFVPGTSVASQGHKLNLQIVENFVRVQVVSSDSL